MFSKLLKHDNRAIFKYWWIGAVVSVAIAVLGGFCLRIANVDYTKYDVLPTIGVVGVTIARFGIYLFPVFTQIIIIIRYYKNFFTDEGYLTFMLPIKKTTHLDSKITSALIFSGVSTVLGWLNLYLIVLIGAPETIGTNEFSLGFSPVLYILSLIVFGDSFVNEFFETTGSFAVPYLVLIILIAIAYAVVQTLFIYACITLASSIVKKHKILTAVGFYYGASSVLIAIFIVLSIWGIFSSYDMIGYFTDIDKTTFLRIILCLLSGVFGVLLAVIGCLYLLLTFLLDKKLNLE